MKEARLKENFLSVLIYVLFFMTGQSTLHAQNFSFSGHADFMYGVYFPGTKFAGDCSDVKRDIYGEVDYWDDEISAFASVEVTCGVKNKQLSENKAFIMWGKAKADIDIKEAWIEFTPSFFNQNNTGLFSIKIGRQIQAWGKADGIKIADILCPENLTTLYSDDYSSGRLGVDAVTLSYAGDVFVANLFWIPIFKGSRLPVDEYNPLCVIPSNIGIGPFSVPVEFGGFEKPSTSLKDGKFFKNGEVAASFCAYLPFADFSAYGFYGFDRNPVMNYEQKTTGPFITGVKVSGEYKRMIMFGLDAAIPVGGVLFRLEGAFYPQRYFAVKPELVFRGAESSIKKNMISALAGIDVSFDEWTFTAQYFDHYIFDYNDAIEQKKHSNGLTLNFSRSFLRETLEFSLSEVINFKDFDSVTSVSCSYKVNDDITVSAGINAFFEGPGGVTGSYGKYKDMSSIFLKAVYRF